MVSKSDHLCSRLQSELAELKSGLTKECDDILSKIDDLMNTEIHTFEKANDYRNQMAERDQSETTAQDEDNMNFYDNFE